MYNAGDFNTTETVNIPFNTFTSDDPAASATITDLAATDLHIHKDGGTTQRSSANGVTVSINFDGITGNHIAHVDLSDDTDAGFYAAGSRYLVRMEGTTVDGATVNAWIGGFSVGCTLRPTTDGRTLDVTATGAAGIDWGNVENPTTTVDLSATDINLVDTCTTNSDMRGTDSAATAASLATAQTDLDTITGSDGVTLATTQANYAPAKATDIVSGGAITTSGGAVSNVTLVATTTTNTDMRGTDSAATAANLATAQADLDILTGTDGVTLATAQANYAPAKATDIVTGGAIATTGGAVDNVTLVATTTTNTDMLTAADVLTTQMTESYAADGAAPTLAQSVLLTQQMLGDFSISGTTMTVKKVDGTTTAGTFTLDDATNPTSLTRAS